MALSADSLPTDLASAHAMIVATREALLAAEARATAAESEAKFRALLIEKLKYTIAKLRHDRFGQSSERSAILEQLELALADLQEDASQAETTAQMAAAQAKIEVRSFERRKPARRPLPEHLPRERIVYPALAACPCCGGALHKIGEDVTESGRTGLSMRVPIRSRASPRARNRTIAEKRLARRLRSRPFLKS
jgi:transposase